VFSSEGGHAGQPVQVVVPPVIHSGDRVRLEEHSPVVDAVFESVALGNAVAGHSVQVRLRIGGRVVRAVATAPGRAVIVAESEVQP
jgi:flagella basal body P-ring formation protein FlgA